MVMRLILCFDGTWDRPAEDPAVTQSVESNVVRFYEAVVNGKVSDDVTQMKWYDSGVGTKWYDRVAGGAFGFGLDQKIRDGYQWLIESYPDSDSDDIDVFILGFSRGAYTARSLVGMIRNVGLLRLANVHRLGDAYALYRRRDDSADTDEAQAFRDRYSRTIEIKFLGVWDTVGALGIPVAALQWLNAAEYGFHDTELSGMVKNAAHAVAIDEHRIDYQVTLWAPVTKEGQAVEQRWFLGAHADVGGGYPDRRLSDITLAWMQTKAKSAGLVINPTEVPELIQSNWMAPISDSYREFLDGTYALTHAPYYRSLLFEPGSNETIDQTVLKRRQADGSYQPQNPGLTPIPSTPLGLRELSTFGRRAAAHGLPA
jgi:uncharacterized protein (DUF2235 family)